MKRSDDGEMEQPKERTWLSPELVADERAEEGRAAGDISLTFTLKSCVM